MFNIDIPNNHNLSRFYNGDAHVVIKDSSLHLSSEVRKIMEIGVVLKDKLEQIMFLFMSTDGGGDRNHRFDRAQALLLWLA